MATATTEVAAQAATNVADKAVVATAITEVAAQAAMNVADKAAVATAIIATTAIRSNKANKIARPILPTQVAAADNNKPAAPTTRTAISASAKKCSSR